MQKSNNDFFAELQSLNAQYGGKWYEQEEKDLYRQFWEMSRNSDKSAYELFCDFKSIVAGTQQREYQNILSVMEEIDASLDALPYTIGPKASIDTRSSHNKARALAAQAKQKKRLAKKRRKK